MIRELQNLEEGLDLKMQRQEDVELIEGMAIEDEEQEEEE